MAEFTSLRLANLVTCQLSPIQRSMTDSAITKSLAFGWSGSNQLVTPAKDVKGAPFCPLF